MPRFGENDLLVSRLEQGSIRDHGKRLMIRERSSTRRERRRKRMCLTGNLSIHLAEKSQNLALFAVSKLEGQSTVDN